MVSKVEAVVLTLRLPKELHRQLAEAATAEERSLNRQIVYLLQRSQV